AACSSSSSTGTNSSGVATCSSPGIATAGAADTHCQGVPAQPVSAASCGVNDAGLSGVGDTDAGDLTDGGAATEDCDYGATMFGNEGDDDDCKYHVVWSSSDLCEGGPGVKFTATVTDKVDGKPVTGMPDGIVMEVFIPSDPNADCDDQSTHPSPSAANLIENSAGSGTYSGNVVFDASGQWTVRFHIHEECADDSPHGHAAFRVTIP
ncbi:MAG: hypothetical protein ACREJX_13605, partial [Polyangiaceae bacterium]